MENKKYTIEFTEKEYEYLKEIYKMYIHFVSISWVENDAPLSTISKKFEETEKESQRS